MALSFSFDRAPESPTLTIRFVGMQPKDVVNVSPRETRGGPSATVPSASVSGKAVGNFASLLTLDPALDGDTLKVVRKGRHNMRAHADAPISIDIVAPRGTRLEVETAAGRVVDRGEVSGAQSMGFRGPQWTWGLRHSVVGVMREHAAYLIGAPSQPKGPSGPDGVS
ncbi:MAG: hypothetical protein ACR2GX_04335 [Candidatus Dormibacteria bacterium]